MYQAIASCTKIAMKFRAMGALCDSDLLGRVLAIKLRIL